MYRENQEKVKSYILFVLIITSLVQVGILWNFQNHGFPISFLSVFFPYRNGGQVLDDNTARGEYFVPYRMIASNGEDSHWLIDSSSNMYDKLWTDAKMYLALSLQTKQLQVDNNDKWVDLAVKKALVFEFKTVIPIDLAKWFVNVSDSSSEGPRGVYKIIISPSENDTLNTIYIYDGLKIYKYSTPFQKKGLSEVKYAEYFNQLEQDKNLKAYSIINELNSSNWPISIKPDILGVFKGEKYMEFHSISGSIPGKISDIEQMAGILLGNDRDSLDRSRDIYDTIVFTGLTNIYKVYKDGLMEYKYIPGAEDADRGSISDAFMNAFRFVSRIRNMLIPGSDLYLSSVDVGNAASYKFTFEYSVGGLPVMLNFDSKGRDGIPLKNAIVVDANAKRVLKCRWLFRDFEQEKDTGQYDIYFQDLLDGLYKTYGKLDYSQLSINDIFAAYQVESDVVKKLEPMWIIERTDDKYYAVPMSK